MNKGDKVALSITILILAVVVIGGIITNEYGKKRCVYPKCTNDRIQGYMGCGDHICCDATCRSVKVEGENYCKEHLDEHAAIVSEMEDAHECKVLGCNNDAYGDKAYCRKHTCSKEGCNEQSIGDGNNYCPKHYNEVYRPNYKNEDEDLESSRNTNSKASGHTGKNNKNNNYTDIPDCDDYDSYEEFMDDWDGYMPDGSDAEDYWENW